MTCDFESYDVRARLVLFSCEGAEGGAVTSLDKPAVGRVTSPRRGHWPAATLARRPLATPPPTYTVAPTTYHE